MLKLKTTLTAYQRNVLLDVNLDLGYDYLDEEGNLIENAPQNNRLSLRNIKLTRDDIHQ